MLSFTLKPSASGSDTDERRPTVLVTGAAGRIGSYFAEQTASEYSLRLMVHRENEESRALKNYGTVVVQDLSDLPQLIEVCRGVDCVLHLAGDPSPNAIWDELLEANIIGTYNLFTAAKAAGCGKIVFASSIHAVSGYPAGIQVKTGDPVNPGDLYGVSKCFGEALGRYFAEQEKLVVIAIRIGAFQPREAAQKADALRHLDAFVSRRDLVDLIRRCINDSKLQFGIFHGLSDNTFQRLDISDAQELLGYAPQDNSTELHPLIAKINIEDQLLAHNLTDENQKSGLREDIPSASHHHE